MRIAMVSNWPRSGRPVSEYAYHLVQGLAEHSQIEEITVLADTFPGATEQVKSGKVRVLRCWDYNSHLTLIKLVGKVRELKPDLCWFNTTLGSFGDSVANFPALLAPLALQEMGIPVLVTLHNLVELTKMDEIGNKGKLTSKGAELATWFLTKVPVCVLLQGYKDVLEKKYKAPRAFLVPIGTLGNPCEEVVIPDNETLICFGIFGTHKKLPNLLDAMRELWEEAPSVRLRIVGGSNSHTPTYLDDLRRQYSGLPNVEFVGYVPEEEVPQQFAMAKALIMPYTTIGGASGTIVQAAMYGKPILVSDLPLFREMGKNYTFHFFDYSSVANIKQSILDLVRRPIEELEKEGRRNWATATAADSTMEAACRAYLEVIEEITQRRSKRIPRRIRSSQTASK